MKRKVKTDEKEEKQKSFNPHAYSPPALLYLEGIHETGTKQITIIVDYKIKNHKWATCQLTILRRKKFKYHPRPSRLKCSARTKKIRQLWIMPLHGPRFYTERLNNKQRNIVNLKVQFTALKAVINQRLNEHEASLDFYNSKHEDFEMQRDNTERDLDCLHQRSDDLSSHITDLQAKIDNLEQYSRRNCLILTGCQKQQAESELDTHDRDVNDQKDQEKENTDEIVLDVFRNIMGARISIDEVERTHRLGRKANINSTREDGLPKSGRPIIIKFSTYRKRQEIFSNKEKFKRPGLVLMENLTKTRMHLLMKAREIVGVKNCWTVDGRIVAIRRDKKIVTISVEEHLEKLYL